MTRNFTLTALTAASLSMVLAACSEAPVEDVAAPAPTTAPSPAAEAPAATPSSEMVDAPPAEDVNPVADLAPPYNLADYDKGRRQFATCRSCHLIEEGAGHRVGPNLHGVFGRTSGSLEDFNYSKALETADFEWTPEELDKWLANPKEYLEGNRMTFVGIANEDQRRNLIAYLLVETAK